jgi:hypothetical protein
VIYFNKQEALRYFGAGREDTRAGAAVDLAFLKLRNELEPKYTARRFACQVTDTAVQVRTGAAAGKKIVFTSRNLAQHLAGCQELFLFAATLGIKVDIAIRRLTLNSAAEGAAAQAVAAALLETYCDACCAELEAKLAPGLKLWSRFSPGYGDWDLAEQQKFFALLRETRQLGLTLTDGCMMAPVKSVTAVLGIGPGSGRTYPNLQPGTQADVGKCAACPHKECEFRRC